MTQLVQKYTVTLERHSEKEILGEWGFFYVEAIEGANTVAVSLGRSGSFSDFEVGISYSGAFDYVKLRNNGTSSLTVTIQVAQGQVNDHALQLKTGAEVSIVDSVPLAIVDGSPVYTNFLNSKQPVVLQPDYDFSLVVDNAVGDAAPLSDGIFQYYEIEVRPGNFGFVGIEGGEFQYSSTLNAAFREHDKPFTRSGLSFSRTPWIEVNGQEFRCLYDDLTEIFYMRNSLTDVITSRYNYSPRSNICLRPCQFGLIGNTADIFNLSLGRADIYNKANFEDDWSNGIFSTPGLATGDGLLTEDRIFSDGYFENSEPINLTMQPVASLSPVTLRLGSVWGLLKGYGVAEVWAVYDVSNHPVPPDQRVFDKRRVTLNTATELPEKPEQRNAYCRQGVTGYAPFSKLKYDDQRQTLENAGLYW